mmetsp:Transcript_78743/g.132119  ORF Transcript_78743/g.132119 Transcript_78743/m.132119 type:complete len:419 (-) Transcript_78743:1562-2818(-)
MTRSTCMAASRPVTSPVAPPGVVGNTKSTVNISWWLRISTISRWSMQNSSTDSRENRPNPPHSCMVRAPSVITPGRSAASRARPPGTERRMFPRCGSVFMVLRLTAIPFPSRRCMTPLTPSYTPSVGGWGGTPAGAFGSNSTNCGSAPPAARSSAVNRLSGTSMSCIGTTSSAMASWMRPETASAVSLNGCPLRSMAGPQAMIAEGRMPASGTGWDRCSDSSLQMPFTSSRVMDSMAVRVYSSDSSGCMKVWPQAVASISHCTTCSLSSWSAWAASITDSERMAVLYRASSEAEMPCSPSRRISSTAPRMASCQRLTSAFRSRLHTAQPSRGQFVWLNSTEMNSGSLRCTTLKRICSEAMAILRMSSRLSDVTSTTGSIGRLANRWKEKLCISSCWKMVGSGRTVLVSSVTMPLASST